MNKRIEPPKTSNKPAPGLDDGLPETTSPPTAPSTELVPVADQSASPDVVASSGPPTEAKDDVEYGRLEFQPKCQACSTATESDVRMVQYRAAGPIAYYRCPRCDKRIKHGRPWQAKNPFGQAPNVAARPDMQ